MQCNNRSTRVNFDQSTSKCIKNQSTIYTLPTWSFEFHQCMYILINDVFKNQLSRSIFSIIPNECYCLEWRNGTETYVCKNQSSPFALQPTTKDVATDLIHEGRANTDAEPERVWRRKWYGRNRIQRPIIATATTL